MAFASAFRLPLLALVLGLPLGHALAVRPNEEEASRQDEIVAIAQDLDVSKALREKPIVSITALDDDLYEVSGGGCKVTVKIHYIAPEADGDSQFEVNVGKAMCTGADADDGGFDGGNDINGG